MSFTARQLHCLDAMGLVAWTSKKNSASESEATTNTDAADAAHLPGSPVTTTRPTTIDEQCQWLLGQPLSGLIYKGSQMSCVGAEQAPLLVVCLHMKESVQLPLSRECAQLFDLMMRAIDVPRVEFRQCAISIGPDPQVQSNTARVYLDDILTPYTRAILMLDPSQGSDSVPFSAYKTLLPPSSVPLWRIPHPDLLLTTPALKRHAWDGLKSLKQVLDDQR
ncbi:MAG: hypothetical protein AB8B64_19925 [Granulosicoccus sp.]